jgi:pyruvate kinase
VSVAAGGHPGSHKTKIICTIGPSSDDLETLKELAKNGMDVARLNLTHGDHNWHKQTIEHIREINRSGYVSMANIPMKF